MRVISQPAAYAAWFVLVLAALVVSYFVDPYKPLEGRRRLAILSFIALTGISISSALVLLRTFKWG